MKETYLVEIYDKENNLLSQNKFKSKREIVQKYNVDINNVNIIIKLNNDPDFKLKSNVNDVKNDLYKRMKIKFILYNL